jgi:hypothetical protein
MTRTIMKPSPKVRQDELGGISAMTEYRWWKLGFPRPMKINGRNYYSGEQLNVDIPEWLSSQNRRDNFEHTSKSLHANGLCNLDEEPGGVT